MCGVCAVSGISSISINSPTSGGSGGIAGTSKPVRIFHRTEAKKTEAKTIFFVI